MSSDTANIQTITTTPYADQRAGTAGLRKKVKTFQQPHYLENFVQSIFDAHEGFDGKTIIVGGDGRYFNDVAIQIILSIAAANGVAKAIVGQNGILSTPAASHLIRINSAHGGFVLSASHNPAGPDEDFGIKFNIAGGGQAPSALTDAIYARSQTITAFKRVTAPEIPLGEIGTHTLGDMTVDVISSTADYAALMQTQFNFAAIRELLAGDFSMAFDAMHAVTGPYARAIFVDLLGAPESAVRNAKPLADFGGGHPDPNLLYAKDLADETMVRKKLDFAAASDGDGDRNMILGKGVFVSPGDSLAVIAANAQCLPAYASGIPGAARSMPTSRALDAVAAKDNFDAYETPTGWKFFCNLLDAGKIAVCGEESFGTGSAHVREKDGVWAVLAWLNILAERKMSVLEIMRDHWAQYGRHYYQRHDYEGLTAEQADAVMDTFRASMQNAVGREINGIAVTQADEFAYDDPIDGSRAEGQGLRMVFGETARIILRKSGTGTSGATIRLYLETMRREQWDLNLPVAETLKEWELAANGLAGIEQHTGRSEPSVIT